MVPDWAWFIMAYLAIGAHLNVQVIGALVVKGIEHYPRKLSMVTVFAWPLLAFLEFNDGH